MSEFDPATVPQYQQQDVGSPMLTPRGVPLDPEYDDELRALVGKNIDGYEDYFAPHAMLKALPKDQQKQVMKAQNRPGNKAWLCMISPLSFFWYRKLWLDGLVIGLIGVLYTILMSSLLGVRSGGISASYRAACMFLGKNYVIWRYRKIIDKARQRFPDKMHRIAWLRERGGTSALAAWLAILGQVALVILFVYGLKHGYI